MLSRFSILASLFLTNLVSAIVPPSFRQESNLTLNNDQVGTFAVSVVIKVGTVDYASTGCGVVVYLKDALNGNTEIQFGQMNSGATVSETAFLSHSVNPSNMAVMISAGGCTDGVYIEQINVAGYPYYLADTSYGSQSDFWVDGDHDSYPYAGNAFCISGIICKLCYDCGYFGSAMVSSNVESKMTDSQTGTNSLDKRGSFAISVTITVGSGADAQSSCGPAVYIEDAKNGRTKVQFGSMGYKASVTKTVYVDYAVNPSNMNAMISAGGCFDGVQVYKMYINGYEYKLSDTTYGGVTNFWVDGDTNNSVSNYYCANGVVCELCRNC